MKWDLSILAMPTLWPSRTVSLFYLAFAELPKGGQTDERRVGQTSERSYMFVRMDEWMDWIVERGRGRSDEGWTGGRTNGRALAAICHLLIIGILAVAEIGANKTREENISSVEEVSHPCLLPSTKFIWHEIARKIWEDGEPHRRETNVFFVRLH